VMALALSVAFRTLLTCLFIFVFGFCAENKFFFFFFYGAAYNERQPSGTQDDPVNSENIEMSYTQDGPAYK